MRRCTFAFAFLMAAVSNPVGAQSLSDRFSQLFTFGTCGQPLCLNVDIVGEHGLHYIPSVTQGENDLLGFITGSIATSLGNLPFTSATSGVTYRFVDGVPQPTSTSAGAIFGERAQTLGKGRLLAGVNLNRLSMETLRGQPLNNLTFRFAHQNVGAAAYGDPLYENDIIEVTTDLKVDLLVGSVFASFGLLDQVDVGVLVPVIHASLEGRSEANLIPYTRPSPHQFGTPSLPTEYADTTADGTASGIGDITVRVKAGLVQRGSVGFAVLADVRLPTGDSANFLGSGSASVRAMGILSGRSGNFSPHINLGYAYRAGETQTNSIIGAFGFDHLVADRVTLAADLLMDRQIGDALIDLPAPVEYTAPTRRRVRLTDLPDRKDNLLDGSVGMKLQFPSGYRLVTNILMPISEGGLRPHYFWTLGFERTF